MGRPLLSTLLDARAPAVRIAQPTPAEPQTPKIDYWSYANPFDPDSEQFWEADNAVYDDFVPAAGTEVEHQENSADVEGDYVRVEVSEPSAIRSRIRSRLLRAAQANSIANAPPPADENARPDLVPSTEGDSSDGMSSGRTSPDVETVELLDARARRDVMWGIVHESEQETEPQQPILESTISTSLHPEDPLSSQESIFDTWYPSDPPSSVHDSPRPRRAEAVPIPLTPPPAPRSAIDIPLSPSPRAAQAAGSPMTPPGSITPRFLTWGASGGMRPRAVDMSPSPTPNAPFGSLRASRMSVSYISPPALRVHQ